MKGLCTRATGSREGAFRQAHTGTLFIGKNRRAATVCSRWLLRGAGKPRSHADPGPIGENHARVDVRVITATTVTQRQPWSVPAALRAVCSIACRWCRSATRAAGSADIPQINHHLLASSCG
ncbi:MAG: sigma 54-interacting transcriptional regulator [Candidatus Competibacteraceae bacterium]|nr:MAG: sigma 54-interacting transcriptional regulator [Candidatus Competibacteraceae bacterium]